MAKIFLSYRACHGSGVIKVNIGMIVAVQK